jgi:hypothetical protein
MSIRTEKIESNHLGLRAKFNTSTPFRQAFSRQGSDSAEWGWLSGGKGRKTKERWGWERFLRKQTDFKRYRSIFGEEKTMRREESSVIPRGRRIIKE